MKKLFTALAMAIVAIFVIAGATAAYADTMNQQQIVVQIASLTPAPVIDTGPDLSFTTAGGGAYNIFQATYSNYLDQPSANETEVTDAAIFNYASEENTATATIDQATRGEPDHPAMMVAVRSLLSGGETLKA